MRVMRRLNGMLFGTLVLFMALTCTFGTFFVVELNQPIVYANIVSAKAKQEVPVEYRIDERYKLIATRIEHSRINISQELKIVISGGTGPDPIAVEMLGDGRLEIKPQPDRDTQTHVVYLLLLHSGGRADPCLIYIPKEDGEEVHFECR